MNLEKFLLNVLISAQSNHPRNGMIYITSSSKSKDGNIFHPDLKEYQLLQSISKNGLLSEEKITLNGKPHYSIFTITQKGKDYLSKQGYQEPLL
jgi:hypothetical protein